MKIKLLLATFLLSSMAAFAHHSFSMFDNTKIVSLTGTIKEFQWTNPHTLTFIDVANADGSGTTTWGIEGMSPNYLGRRGWTKTTLKPGDKVTINIFPLKGDKKGGTFLTVKMPDGKEMVMLAAQVGAALPQ